MGVLSDRMNVCLGEAAERVLSSDKPYTIKMNRWKADMEKFKYKGELTIQWNQDFTSFSRSSLDWRNGGTNRPCLV